MEGRREENIYAKKKKEREKKISVCAFEALSFTFRGGGSGRGRKRSLIASGSAASAGKLNKHRHSCFAVQIYVSEGLGAMHAARCGSRAAKQRRAPSCPLEPSRIILFFFFYKLSCRITEWNSDGGRNLVEDA